MKKLLFTLLLTIALLFLSACSDDGGGDPGPSDIEEEIAIEAGTYANQHWINIEEDNKHGSKFYLVSDGSSVEKQVRYFHRERITSDWIYDSTVVVGSAVMQEYRGFCITEGLQLLNGYVVSAYDDYQYLYLGYTDRFTGDGSSLTSGEWVNTELYNYNTEVVSRMVIRFDEDGSGYFELELVGGDKQRTDFTYRTDNNNIYIRIGTDPETNTRYALHGNKLYLATGATIQWLKVND